MCDPDPPTYFLSARQATADGHNRGLLKQSAAISNLLGDFRPLLAKRDLKHSPKDGYLQLYIQRPTARNG